MPLSFKDFIYNRMQKWLEFSAILSKTRKCCIYLNTEGSLSSKEPSATMLVAASQGKSL